MKKSLLFYMTGLALVMSCNTNTSSQLEQAPAPAPLSSIHRTASCVYLTSDEKNNPLISWCEMDSATKRKYFFVSFFDNKKNEFINKISVPIEQNVSIHEEGMPKVAIKNDGTIVIVYEVSTPTKENEWAGAIHYIQSSDKGKTWTQPLCVHADSSSNGSRSFASVTRLSNGEIGVCWLDNQKDHKKDGRPLKFAATLTNKGFQPEILIDSFACECCRTAISSDDKGSISILFRDILPDSERDISFSRSADNGKTFSPATPFSNDKWVINGCPHNGPSVVNKSNISYATWFTGGHQKGVYYGELKNGAMVLKKLISNDGKFIQLCLMPDGKRMIAYNENVQLADSFYSKIVVVKFDGNHFYKTGITSDKSHAGYPVICALDNKRVMVAWTENDRVYYQIVDVSKITNLVKDNYANNNKTKSLPVIQLTNKKDPVCGMHVDSNVEDTIHFNGKIIGFCSKHCKDKFLSAPATLFK
ncbi:MAG: exo-alpha-sialidase [Bacteroidetes bacterium]|nr:exo-alpha-sialidase [Bacteroidota bacterium]